MDEDLMTMHCANVAKLFKLLLSLQPPVIFHGYQFKNAETRVMPTLSPQSLLINNSDLTSLCKMYARNTYKTSRCWAMDKPVGRMSFLILHHLPSK